MTTGNSTVSTNQATRDQLRERWIKSDCVIQYLKEKFPGLCDDETEVNASELVFVLKAQIKGMDL